MSWPGLATTVETASSLLASTSLLSYDVKLTRGVLAGACLCLFALLWRGVSWPGPTTTVDTASSWLASTSLLSYRVELTGGVLAGACHSC